jgi:hypothetical protein
MTGTVTAHRRANWFALVVFLYVALYYLSDLIADNQALGGIASLIYLPAFVRVLGFLLLGFWSVPALFIANLIVIATGGYDLGPGMAAEVLLSLLTALGAPIGAAVICSKSNLAPNLANLNGSRLFLLSLGAATGNAIAIWFGHFLLDTPGLHLGLPALVIIGDALGTWAVIYALKALLTFAGMTLRHRD